MYSLFSLTVTSLKRQVISSSSTKKMQVRKISDYKWNDEKKGSTSGLRVSSAFPNMNIKQLLVKELYPS